MNPSGQRHQQTKHSGDGAPEGARGDGCPLSLEVARLSLDGRSVERDLAGLSV
jgi:hypothetical protein